MTAKLNDEQALQIVQAYHRQETSQADYEAAINHFQSSLVVNSLLGKLYHELMQPVRVEAEEIDCSDCEAKMLTFLDPVERFQMSKAEQVQFLRQLEFCPECAQEFVSVAEFMEDAEASNARLSSASNVVSESGSQVETRISVQLPARWQVELVSDQDVPHTTTTNNPPDTAYQNRTRLFGNKFGSGGGKRGGGAGGSSESGVGTNRNPATGANKERSKPTSFRLTFVPTPLRDPEEVRAGSGATPVVNRGTSGTEAAAANETITLYNQTIENELQIPLNVNVKLVPVEVGVVSTPQQKEQEQEQVVYELQVALRSEELVGRRQGHAVTLAPLTTLEALSLSTLTPITKPTDSKGQVIFSNLMPQALLAGEGLRLDIALNL